MGVTLFTEVMLTLMSVYFLMLSFSKQHKEVIRTIIYVLLAVFSGLFAFFASNITDFIGGIEGMFYMSQLSSSSKVLLLGCAFSLMLLARAGLKREDPLFERVEFYVIFLLMLVGSFLMIASVDFMALYLSMELQALCVYVLMSFRKDNSRTLEASIKYFVLSAVSSGVFLYGVSFIYGFTGSTNFSAVYTVLSNASLNAEMYSLSLYIGMLLVLLAFTFKVALIPFHAWAPDVYQGTPIWIATLFATLSKVVGVTVLINLVIAPFSPLARIWSVFFLLVGMASIILGTLSSLAQRNIMRLLAFSSIAQMGFIALVFASGSYIGLEQAYAYLVIYLVMTLGVFMLLNEAYYRVERSGYTITEINDLAGFSKVAPGWAFMLAMFLFSLAGIPPLAGFFAKLYVLMSLINHQLVWVAIAAIIISVIGAFYYLRIVKIMYFDDVTINTPSFAEFDVKTFLLFRVPSLLCLLFVLGYVVYPNGLVRFVVHTFKQIAFET